MDDTTTTIILAPVIELMSDECAVTLDGNTLSSLMYCLLVRKLLISSATLDLLHNKLTFSVAGACAKTRVMAEPKEPAPRTQMVSRLTFEVDMCLVRLESLCLAVEECIFQGASEVDVSQVINKMKTTTKIHS